MKVVMCSYCWNSFREVACVVCGAAGRHCFDRFFFLCNQPPLILNDLLGRMYVSDPAADFQRNPEKLKSLT